MMNNKNNYKNSKQFMKDYYKILSPEFPVFLNDYINTPAMQRLDAISISCGCNYTKLYNLKFIVSNLQHSIGVALIIWHFTKDKNATLSGLFHDIATPCFKHCIDFLRGDPLKQETTENLNEQMIRDSKELMKLLIRDNIKLEEVCDYKIYPIADNDTPKLSADRLDYTFTNGIFWNQVWSIDKIKELYDDMTVANNENGIPEICFKTKQVAEDFVARARELWPLWYDSKNKLLMQFYADILLIMKNDNLFFEEDLYKLTEKQLLNKILKCKNKRISKAFKNFQKATQVYDNYEFVAGKYCKKLKTKKRFIVPLVLTDNGIKRITEVSKTAKEKVESWLKFEVPEYAYFDFEI